MEVFAPNKDREIREGIRTFYYNIIHQEKTPDSVFIKLPIKEWISANALNMLLTFVEAIQLYNSGIRIFIEILDMAFIEKVLNSTNTQIEQDTQMSDVSNKLRFFEAMEFIDHLRNRRVIVQPSCETIAALQDKLNAHKKERKYLYSTRMLSLNPLVESEEDQFALTARIETLTSILYKNLWGRLDKKSIEEASKQIMFELVKNVYQHSGLPEKYSSLARGFACAQLNSYETIKSNKYPKDIVSAILGYIKDPIKNKRFTWLCITISDFGIGLSKSMAHFLDKYFENSKTFKKGQFELHRPDLKNEGLLIEIAATTDFSTKSDALQDKWIAQDKVYSLARRGYGLIYCIGFIARTFGRMRIRSGSAEVDIYPKPETVLQQEIWSDVFASAAELEKRFPFDVEIKKLDEKQSEFPGTQLLIEIPVETWVKNSADDNM